MTLTFEHKQTEELVKYDNVKFFTTDATMNGVRGFDLHFTDGDEFIVPRKKFRLIMVKA